jgi:cation transport ATPase
LTILVIGCPGALVIATPVAFVAGIGRAANLGILVKGGEYLETIGKVTTVAFDKTGTLTQGKPRLTNGPPSRKRDPVTLWRGLLSLRRKSGWGRFLPRSMVKQFRVTVSSPGGTGTRSPSGRPG